MWAGIAGSLLANKAGFEVAISIHDSVYNTDFSSTILPYDASQSDKQTELIESHIISTLRKFSSEHLCKFLGAGVTLSLLREVRALLFRSLMAYLTPFRPQLFVLVYGWSPISSPSSSISNLITPTRPLALMSNTALGPLQALLPRQVLKHRRFMSILPFSGKLQDFLPLRVSNRSFQFHALSMNKPTRPLAKHSCTMAPAIT